MVLVALVASALLSGCNTLADARDAEGTGPSRIYEASPGTVWAALPDIVRSVGLDYVGDNREEGYVLAQHAISALSWGEDVAIFVQPAQRPGSTRVEVDSKRALATNITATNWELVILDALSSRFPSN